ncbi:MAG TPA: LLM class F420-dependent oxidoreductase [Acidimicrobiia bacterium]|nr:LLM class F420-dependent oxidoreductase [Acidimicrobiia bacterium]
MVECPVLSDADGGAWLDPDNIAEFARTAESSGVDALSFTEHPAPSKKWLDGGGHETFDPFVALGFCAAATSTIRLMTNLTVVPYRNPLLLAKSMTSVDVLSGGRTIFTLGTGYLRSEFAALGVEFEERNELFDEAVDVLRGVWSTDDFTYDGRHFKAIGQIIKPGPVSVPYPTLWLGGNSKIVLDRVARWGDGWAPMLGGGEILAKTTRTANIGSEEKLAAMIRDLGERLEANGRALADVDISAMSMTAQYTPGRPAVLLDALGHLAEIGVTWSAVHTGRDPSFAAALDGLRGFGEEVIARAP